MNIIELLQYSFIQKAFIAGAFVSVSCAVLGVFLVLRKMSLIGDGLSHVSFGAIALGLFLGVYPFYVAVPVAIVSSLLILWISERVRVYGDAAIGIVSSVGISSGVVLASVSGGFNVDIFSYLFGNILSISSGEVWLSVLLSILVLSVVYIFYWDLFSTTFDNEYAKATGVNTRIINSLIVVLTSLVVVLSVKVVGVMLVSSSIILPAVTSLQVSTKFKSAIFTAVFSALSAVLLGILFSFYFDIPTGATIVLMNVFFLSVTFIYKKIKE